MNKEVLTPIKDELLPTPWNVRWTTFKLGPTYLSLILKDTTKLPQQLIEQMKFIEENKENIFKKYIIFGIISDTDTYVLGEYDTKADAWVNFKDLVQKLKFGETIEMKDQAGVFNPIRVSYKGINWIWE